MENKKDQAIKLRQSGKSYSEIGWLLGIQKSTLSYWLRNVYLSPQAVNRLKKRVYEKSIKALIRRNKAQTVEAGKRALIIRKQSSDEIKNLTKNNLFLIGIALYWGEGYKKGAEGRGWKCVNFTNSDPKMIQLMMRFFREVCHAEEAKFRVQIMIHKKTQTEKALKFWSKITAIDKKQFIKTSYSISSSSRGKRKNILEYGTVHIRVYDVKLFYRIIGWIDGLKKQSGCSSVG